MKVLLENWFIFVALAACAGVGAYMVYSVMKKPSEMQLKQIKEWLIYAVVKAEKKLGSGTGQIKLRYVYDMFVGRFGWVAEVISFDTFKIMVDEALEKMETMLKQNESIMQLVTGENVKDKELEGLE